MQKQLGFRLLVLALTILAVCGAVYRPADDAIELRNRIPEAAPYVTEEAQFFPPPFEEYWTGSGHPGQCQSCHQRIFQEWSGSMMANAWRDPVWRGAFLLLARQTSTSGDCELPDPPDGTIKARHNPFAVPGECASEFDLGNGTQRVSRPGSLVDGFCSRCHMPSNYVDNVPLQDIVTDQPSGLEHGRLAPDFNPTSDAGTGIAFATDEERFRNTDSGKSGVFCAVCHSIAESRDTPYHDFARTTSPRQPEYVAARGTEARSLLLPELQDMFAVPDSTAPNLGYGIGAGSFRLSPHAIGFPERLGPMPARPTTTPNRYLEGVFKQPMPYEQVDSSKHNANHHVFISRAELCSGCHDVTNPLTIKNRVGKWVGAFPIERTYTEWLNSRYADRPGNRNFDPAHKRDCQTCHMQQDYGQPGTAETLYREGTPAGPLTAPVADGGRVRPYFSHHFVGGNSYVPRLIGASVNTLGTVSAYPKLSAFSFTSADEKSPYHNAFWTDVESRGAPAQQARLAWDRLRHVIDLEVTGPRTTSSGARAPLTIRVTNRGSGHKFPTGFPEGRVAWLAVRAFELGSGRELEIHDSQWNRTSAGVGGLTAAPTIDPTVPGCEWKLPAGSPDPYAVQFKAVATLGDGCPTLDLPYAHAPNLVVNEAGQPVDNRGRVIDRNNPKGQPQYQDRDGDGDVYDDSFLSDTRLDPLPRRGATLPLDRYSVVIPADVVGPVAVSAAVYYQSVEAIAAVKLLGNLADTDLDFHLEPCVLGGACDGRRPSAEPAVVEGSPPVPMEVRNWVIRVNESGRGPGDVSVSIYPPPDAVNVYRDAVVKATFSEPVAGVDTTTFTLRDSRGNVVPASVDQIGDGTWALFPHQVFLKANERYSVRIDGRICGLDAGEGGNCLRQPRVWRFVTVAEDGTGQGDTSIPVGFDSRQGRTRKPPAVDATSETPSQVTVTFSEPVMNVTSGTLVVRRAAAGLCLDTPVLPGTVSQDESGFTWTYVPDSVLDPGSSYCLDISADVYDLDGERLPKPFRSVFSPRAAPAAARPQ